MPEKKTIKKAQKAKRQGKAPSTQAGAFVEEEMHHIREGKHGAKNTKQAIAIGLSKARQSGVVIPDAEGKKSSKSRRIQKKEVSSTRSKAGEARMMKEPKSAASHRAISKQARKAAKNRTAAEKHESAMKAVNTKGMSGLKKAATKAAKTRAEHKRAA